ncbi:MAG: hypothetical protein PHQ35_05335 [Phycisphaerae bacterium]|nr:hypothetical protein [Phycisphaerae bacterium]MDD5380861.1 hypothetical protein [Phycisphaerae bacterium]
MKMSVKYFPLYLLLISALALSPCYGADTTAPRPVPAKWWIVPITLGPNSIQMAAVTALDQAGSVPIQYLFECSSVPTASSTWQTDANYIATSLTPSTVYTFRVRARDSALNMTSWSLARSATTDASTTPPVLRLDLNNWANNDDVNTQVGFMPLSITTSGSEVNGVITDLGGSINSVRRDDPCGGWSRYAGTPVMPGDPCYYSPRAGERIYRDFVYGVNPSGVTITLWGLGTNRDCNITIWSWDSQILDANRVANWYANGTHIFDTNFIGGAANQPLQDNYSSSSSKDFWKWAFSGRATSDDLGRIILTSERGPSSPAAEPFAFVNALQVEPNALQAFVLPSYAYHPVPVDGAEDAPIDAVLEWKKGGLAETHDVYFGTDFNDINNADRDNSLGVLVSQNQSTTTYDPPGFLDFSKTYYWRIDEVNAAPDYTIFKGEVWSFKVLPHFVLDNFSSYEDNAAMQNIWQNSGTSAEVSIDIAIARSGKSMRYIYNNNLPPYYSEVSADVADLGMVDPDWLGIGAQALVLYFYGDLSNPTDEQMYVKLTDGDSPPNTATVTYDNTSDVRRKQWSNWSIPLTEFADVNLSNVAGITIGFGDGSGGSTGNVYFDDVRGSATSVSPTSLRISAEANSTGTFTVTSNTSWTVSSSEYWLTVDPASGSNNDTVTVTAQQNGLLSRAATVAVTTTGDAWQTVTVTQGGTGGNECTVPPMPSFSSLVDNPYYPDPFEFVSGSCMTKDEWTCRRAEIAELIQEFELGYMPETPYSATTGSFNGNSITVYVTDNGHSTSFSCSITYPPTGSPPYPAMIGYGGSISIGATAIRNLGVATMNLSTSATPFNTLYGSDPSVSSMMKAAWNLSRLIDALEKTPAANIDPNRLGITGCSASGKGALVCGAFNPRIKLTIPQESGAGGAASWRGIQSEGGCETMAGVVGLGLFSANFTQFVNNADKLPFDHHELAGLCAPNALLFIENTSHGWLCVQSCWQNGNITHKIWEALGIPDKMGFSGVGGHDHCVFPASQQPHVNAYVEKFLVGGGTADTNIMYTDGGFTFDEAPLVDWTILPPRVDLTLPNLKGDLNHDCGCGYSDLALLVERWLNEDCLYNGWCYEADLNYDGDVDFRDYAELAVNWLEGN